MRKAYSYDGLNYQVGDDYRKAKTELVWVKIPSLSMTLSGSRGIKYNYANQVSRKEFLFKLDNNLTNTMNLSRTSIHFSNKPSLKAYHLVSSKCSVT